MSDLPPWPVDMPAAGAVLLRAFRPDDDVQMALDLATDPYVPLIGTLPANATEAQAHDWILRQLGRWDEGKGFSFAIAQVATGRAVGAAGLWLTDLEQGRATAGYSVAPTHRRRGYAAAALTALTRFAWTLPGLHRIELHIEPSNLGSRRTAERADYRCDGLVEIHRIIGGRRRDMLLYKAIRPSVTARSESSDGDAEGH